MISKKMNSKSLKRTIKLSIGKKVLNKLTNSKIFKNIEFKFGFSLIEIMVSLVVVSMLAASFAPVVTKKITASTIKTSGGLKLCAVGKEHCNVCIKDKCLACEAGYYVKDGACKNCREDFNAINCTENGAIDCDSGYYVNDAKSCTECEAGNKCNGKTKTACPVGYYQLNTGRNFCDPCEIGQYQNETGQNTCKICTNKTYQDQIGQSFCKSSTTVTNCSIYYTTKNACKTCVLGCYFSAANKCDGCSPGYYCPDGVSAALCGSKTYTSSWGASSCTNSTSVTYCLIYSTQSDACLICDSTHTLSDNVCVEGSAGGSGNSDSCICADGTCGGNLTYCTSCNPGYYLTDTTCSPCPAGSYCAGGSSTSPTGTCGFGYYSTGGAAECTAHTSTWSCTSTSTTENKCTGCYNNYSVWSDGYCHWNG